MFLGYLLFYLCDTDEGSSGAPLVQTTEDGHRQVIALHRGWQKLKGNTYNFGTLMGTIIDHIHGNCPNYCKYLLLTCILTVIHIFSSLW